MEIGLIITMLISLTVLGVMIGIFFMSRNLKSSVSQTQRYINQLGKMVYQSQQHISSVEKLVMHAQHDITANNSRIEALSAVTQQVHQSGTKIYQDIGIVRETTTQMLEMRNDIAKLQRLLQSSRYRGKIGEVILSTVLEDALPAPAYELQYQFTTGQRVDAIIHLDKGLISVDAKFPLTNFEELLNARDEESQLQFAKQFIIDVRGHVDAVAQYIVPNEGTLDFALMFVPSEAVYYEIVARGQVKGKQSLIAYAFEKRVFPVSPNTFYPYLLTIARGLRELYVADNVQQTIREIAQLEKEFEAQSDKWATARRQIDHARNNLSDVQVSLDNIGETIRKIGRPLEIEDDSPELTQLTDPTK